MACVEVPQRVDRRPILHLERRPEKVEIDTCVERVGVCSGQQQCQPPGQAFLWRCSEGLQCVAQLQLCCYIVLHCTVVLFECLKVVWMKFKVLQPTIKKSCQVQLLRADSRLCCAMGSVEPSVQPIGLSLCGHSVANVKAHLCDSHSVTLSQWIPFVKAHMCGSQCDTITGDSIWLCLGCCAVVITSILPIAWFAKDLQGVLSPASKSPPPHLSGAPLHSHSQPQCVAYCGWANALHRAFLTYLLKHL
jgi:hypothetical protein